MVNHIMTSGYLETLSSADLISLADEYGIDIPEDLNRRFIIAELLDIAREMQEDGVSELTITDENPVETELPVSYNETSVGAVRINPMWLYVWWDIGAAEREQIHSHAARPSLILRVAVIEHGGKVSPAESFDVPVDIADSDQYIPLPASEGEKKVKIELILETDDDKPRLLADSAPVPLARPCPDFRESFLRELPPLLELSGFKELMRTHFLQHRQSFS
jgi:hypothetical protein